jgi:hypothetical protein
VKLISIVPPELKTLDDIRSKISWSRTRIEELDTIAKAFFKDGFYTIVLEQDAKGCLVSRFGNVRPFPIAYSLLIGEIAHQLRSSLDHLIFAVARPATPGQEQRVKFPLCSTGKRFRDMKSSSLCNVPRGVLSLVESVQPYHCRKRPETRFLGQLQTIHNWDKHRSLTVASAVLRETNVELRIIGDTSIIKHEIFGGRIERDKIISRTLTGYSEVGAEIEYHPNFTFYPAFDKGLPKEIAEVGVRGILTGAGAFIEEEIVPKFQKFFI